VTLPDGALTLLEVIEKVNKDYGEDTLIRGSAIKKVHPRLSTGLLAVDAALGGGWVANQFNGIIGEYSSGKSAIAMASIAYNQALDPGFTAVWVAAEEFVGDWAEANGMDLSRLLLIESNVMEEVYETVLKLLETHEVDLIVIDSLPALVPKSEDEKDVEEFTIGLGARINNKFFRKGHKSTKRSLVEEQRPCTVVLINQWREAIGVMHGDNRTAPGGKGKEFALFTNVDLRRTEWITAGKKRVGQTVRTRVIKNKIAPPQRVSEVDFYFEAIPGHPVGYDTGKDVFVTALYYGLLGSGGGGVYAYGDQKWKGQDKVRAAVLEDLDLQAALRADVLRIVHPGSAPEPKKVNGTKKLAVKKAAARRA
jgi:recombination protein RecA